MKAVENHVVLQDNLVSSSRRYDVPATCFPHGLRPLDLHGPDDRPFEPLAEDWIDVPILDHLRWIAACHPNRIAIRDLHVAFSYRELVAAVARLAATIATMPCRHGAIGLLLPNDARHPIASLACLAAGRLAVPFDLSHPEARIANLLGDIHLDGLLVSEGGPGQGPGPGSALRPDLTRIDIASCLHGPALDLQAIGIADPDGAVAVLHTSGSSGRPSPVVISQAGLLQRVLQQINACHVDELDQVCPLSSPCTISGMREQLTALLTGATLHVVSPLQSGLAELRQLIADRRISIIYAIPTLVRAVLEADGRPDDLASLRVLRIGGDSVLWRDVRSLRRRLPATCRILISFSSTEAPGLQWFVPDGHPDDGIAAPIGYALPGARLEILAEDGRPVAPGEFGELVIRSRAVALGCWRDGACAPGAFRVDPEDPAARIHHSGDLVAIDPDGLYLFGGRKDRQAKIRGQRVDLTEIEAALRAVAGLQDVAVMAAADAPGPAIVAFIQARPGIDPELLLHRATQALAALPEIMRPARRHLVGAIPRLPSAKLDLAALRALDDAGARVAPPAAETDPRTAGRTERVVARAWREALGRGCGAHQASWAEAGGDSLRLLQFSLEIERRIGRAVPLELFRSDMRPADFVAAIERLLRPSTMQAPETRTLVLFFPGIEDDNPALARFRDTLREQARFETVSYPSWQTMVRAGGGLDRFVELACRRILAEPPDVAVHLAGYSFGAVVALALARRMLELDRPVSRLTVFDTNLGNFAEPHDHTGRVPASPGRFMGALRQLGSTTGRATALADLTDLLARLAFHRLTIRRAGRLPLPLPRRLPRRTDLVFRWALRRRMGSAWLHRPAQAAAVPVLLFRTDDHPDAAPHDLGWSAQAGPVSVHEVDGGHLTMFWPPHSLSLAERFSRLGLQMPAFEPAPPG